jgi:hypothetical protein
MIREIGWLLVMIAVGVGCGSKKKDEELKKAADKAAQEMIDAMQREMIKKEYDPLKARYDKGEILKYDDYSGLRKEAYMLEKDTSTEGVALLKTCRTLTDADAPAREQIAAMNKNLENIKTFGADEFWAGAMKGDCTRADELLAKIKEAKLGETEGEKLLTAKKTEACTPENTTPQPKKAAATKKKKKK